jgi:UDP-N-acetylglucosamine diphosphorylase/glucosamine-1-phosphate N-acetyltransferase
MADRGLGITIYEDDSYSDLFPLTHMRPSFQILSGMGTLLWRLQRLFPEARVCLFARSAFTGLLKQEFPDWEVNDTSPRSGLFLNGRCLRLPESVFDDRGRRALTHRGAVIGFWTPEEVRIDSWGGLSSRTVARLVEKTPKEEIEAVVLEHPWDLIGQNGALVKSDFESSNSGGILGVVDPLAVLVGDASLFSLGAGSAVEPFCVIDVREGPVSMGEGVLISSHSTVRGPCHISDGSVIEAAVIRGETTVGPVCRISGEVEASVFQGWSNKHHLGFIGHSWIGEWVNIGAGTNNSDLKNNYGRVRVGPADSPVDTGMQKLGCFLGDHTKTGIGTLLNTGAVIGPFSNLLGGAVSPKYLSPFSWQGPSGFEHYRLDEAIATARTVMRRRSVEMGEDYERLVRELHEASLKRR